MSGLSLVKDTDRVEDSSIVIHDYMAMVDKRNAIIDRMRKINALIHDKIGETAASRLLDTVAIPQKLEDAIKAVDSSMWMKFAHNSGLQQVMPSKDWSDFIAQIYACDTPPFESEHIEAFLSFYNGNIGEVFARKVYSVFQSLSRYHKSNSPFHFGRRLIFTYVHNDGCMSYNHRAIPELLECVCTIMGRTSSHLYDDIARKLIANTGKTMAVDGNAILMRSFKNGNVHAWLHPDVAAKMNKILATHCGLTLGSARNFDYRKQRDKGSASLVQVTLSDGERRNLADARVTKEGDLWRVSRCDRLAPYAKKQDGVTLWFDFDPSPIIDEMVTNGVVPDYIL